MEVVQSLGRYFHLISAVSSSEGKIKHEQVFYLSPEQHIYEMFFANLIFGALLFVTLRKGKSKEEAEKKHIQKDDIQVLSFFAKTLRFVLTICFLVTLYHKFNGGKLSLMMMPCHTVTLCYLASMYSKKHSTGEFIFNIAVHYMFFTWLALLMPDHKGLTQVGEIPNFWIHHWVLLIIPLYLIFTKHYSVDHVGHYNFKLAAATGALLHFNFMTLAGIVSGHNVGYMLLPPPKTPVTGPYFRWAHAGFLIVMGFVSGYMVPWIIVKVRDICYTIFKLKSH